MPGQRLTQQVGRVLTQRAFARAFQIVAQGGAEVGVRAGEYGRRFPERGAENVAAIDALATAGRIRPHVYAVLDLADWREAFAMLEKREAVGKAVLRP